VSEAAVSLDRAQIQEIIPHRDPFLLLDEVVELVPGERCHARRTLRPDEFWFAGHFPEDPVMPGVLIVEALAQAGAVAALSHPANAGKLVLFAGIDKVRFKRVVRPGDTLDLIVEVTATRAVAGKARAEARVDGHLACRGELMMMLVVAAQAAAVTGEGPQQPAAGGEPDGAS
jgi:3-hydroxyacyl-[acyl-carrier-protein] dehydratase